MLDVGAAMLANQAMNHLITGRVPQRGGNRHPNIQPQDVFAAQDGSSCWRSATTGSSASCARCWTGRTGPPMSGSPPTRGGSGRMRRSPHCWREAFAGWPREALIAALDAAGVPAAPINTIDQVFADPQLQHRGMLQHVPHPLGGTVPQVVSPIRLQDAPLRFDRAPPLLGQHTDEVLRELGLRLSRPHERARRDAGWQGPRVPILTAEEMNAGPAPAVRRRRRRSARADDRPVAGRDPQPGAGDAMVAARRVPALPHLPAAAAERVGDRRHRAALDQPGGVVGPCRAPASPQVSRSPWWTRSGRCSRRRFEDAADLEVYEFARLLQQTGRVPEAVYADVQRRWGTRGGVELVAVIGYYTMVSMTLNAHQLPLPEGAIGLPSATTLVTLPPGTMRATHGD